MRRKDRQMEKDDALRVLDRAPYAVLSLLDEDGAAYGVPLSFVHKDGVLYFHGAFAGRKIAGLKKHPAVSLCAVDMHRVPAAITKEEYEETKRIHGSIAPFLKNKFTTEYRSALVKGRVAFVEDPDEKRLALRRICEKYTPDNAPYIAEAVETGLSYTQVWKLVIDTLTGKTKDLGIRE